MSSFIAEVAIFESHSNNGRNGCFSELIHFFFSLLKFLFRPMHLQFNVFSHCLCFVSCYLILGRNISKLPYTVQDFGAKHLKIAIYSSNLRYALYFVSNFCFPINAQF
ncbi:hypothetical protein CsSME_00019104 [Camellia sinensis var. sinensis]